MRELLTGLDSPQARLKLSASKALRDLSLQAPELVYPHFDVFVPLLGHENNILKWNAILTLAHLARVDRDGKLDRLLDIYLAPISGPVMITAANTFKGAALIAQARPHLADRIATHLIHVEKARYATAECRNLAIGHALQALQQLMGALGSTRSVRSFAARQINNPRPATAKKAARLLASSASVSKSRSRS